MLSLSAPEPIRQTSMCQGLTGWVWISHVALLCTAKRGGMGAPGEGPNGKTHCQWKRTRKVRLMQQISWTVMVVTPVFLLDANMQVRSSIILLMVFIKYINSNHNWSPYIYIMLLHEFIPYIVVLCGAGMFLHFWSKSHGFEDLRSFAGICAHKPNSIKIIEFLGV